MKIGMYQEPVFVGDKVEKTPVDVQEIQIRVSIHPSWCKDFFSINWWSVGRDERLL